MFDKHCQVFVITDGRLINFNLKNDWWLQTFIIKPYTDWCPKQNERPFIKTISLWGEWGEWESLRKADRCLCLIMFMAKCFSFIKQTNARTFRWQVFNMSALKKCFRWPVDSIQYKPIQLYLTQLYCEDHFPMYYAIA